MQKKSKVYVAGHRGMVGSAIVKALIAKGYEKLLLKTHDELDLCDQKAIRSFYDRERPDYVFVAAAKVGGILANDSYPVDFLYDNLLIAANLIEGAYSFGAKKLLFLGSTCIYPRLAPQPMREEYLLTGPLEQTNQWYAIAKIAGIKLCQAYQKQYQCGFISAMPTNLYGPNDNFDLQNSHVMPALIRKVHEAKVCGENSVVVWGSGKPRREFLHVDDCAAASIFLMENYESPEIINIGVGKDITIRELAEMVAHIVGFKGEIIFDASKPDGTPRKLVDVSRINALGWKALISLEKGIRSTYEWYRTTYTQNNNKISHVDVSTQKLD